MSNHQSMFDIPALIAAIPNQTRFLAKRELFKIPIFGWALWIGGFVPVERGDRSRSRVTLDAASDRLRRHLSLLIFPEETRSRDGRLLPFKSGGFLLAAKAGVPVVPAGVHGTMRVQPKGRYTMTPGEVTVRFGAPVAVPDDGARAKRALVHAVRAEIARLARTTVADEVAAAAGEAPAPVG
jgi:1-acyl-sn-glycerol-3-phosphate acyltransferase